MEFPTLPNSATPAKCALLARLQQHNKFIVPTADEIAAAIDAARCGPAPTSFDLGDDDDELVEAVSVPVAPRRQRKRSLTSTLRAAHRAGADRVVVDGVVIVLSPAAPVPASDANEWDAVLPEADHASH